MLMKKISQAQSTFEQWVSSNENMAPHVSNGISTEGDDTAYGQALFPIPAEDPNDPLQVC
jgi:hypothetical protein